MNTSPESLPARIVALVLCLALAFPVPARANDRAGTPNVVHGGASISRDGDNVTVVTSTDRTIISWDRFGVPVGSTTHFAQPGVNSATLNRVQGSLPSHINGTLSSNGAVYVTNPNGVVVGANGVVRADGGFVASGMNVSDADFLGGGPNGTASMRFSNGSGYGAGVVENHGVVQSAYGDVFLLGSRVTNSGRVSAANGTVGFGAGQEVVIHPVGRANGRMEVVATEASFAGGTGVYNSGVVNAAAAELRAHGDHYKLAVNNTGVIEARGVERTPDGRVFLSAGGRGGTAAGSVVNAGSIRAVNADRSGGSVYMTGGNVTLAARSVVDVSAEYGRGGVALVGGAYQGAVTHWQDADIEIIVPSATSVTMESGAVINADAAGAGDGGLAVLWSEGETRFDGSISARGGELAGDGGMVETSGRDLFVAGHVDTRAPEGKTGTYLLDPTNLTIDDGSSGGANDIAAATLAYYLSSTNMVLTTSPAPSRSYDPGLGDDAGNITVEAAVVWNSDNSLTLLAHNDILVNANIQNAGTGGVTLVAGWDGITGDLNGYFDYSTIAPADLGGLAAATWFGNTTNGSGSVIITNASVGSRLGETLVFANDVRVGGMTTLGDLTDAWGRIGYVVPGSANADDITASGEIGVYAKGDVALRAGAGVAQIGHTWRGRVDGGTHRYDLTADGAGINVMAGEGVSLAAGEYAIDRYAQIGHGGGIIDNDVDISSTLNAEKASISVTAGGAGGVELTAGHAYSRIGHGGALSMYSSTNTLSSSVDATGSAVTVTAASGDVSLKGGGYFNSSSQIGHGYALHHGGSNAPGEDPPPIRMTSAVTVDDATVAVKAAGAVTLTAGNSPNTYAQIGHGGGMSGTVTKSPIWSNGGGADIAVIADSLTLAGGDSGNASIGNIIYDNYQVHDTGWSLRPDTNNPATADTMLIRITSPSTLIEPIVATGQAGVYHGGSGSFSLLADSGLNVYDVVNVLNLITHTGETNFVAGGSLMQGSSFTAGGAVNLLAGWKDEAGWSDTATPMFKIGDAMAAPIDQTRTLSLGRDLTAKGNLYARAGTITVHATVTNDDGDFSLFRAEKNMTWRGDSFYSSDKADHQLILDLTKATPSTDPNTFTNSSTLGADVFDLEGAGARWLIWAETDLSVNKNSEGVVMGGLDKTKRQFETVAPDRTYGTSGWELEDPFPTISFTVSGFVFTDDAPEIVVNSPGDLTYTYGDNPDSAVAALKQQNVDAGWAELIDADATKFILGDTLDDITLTYTAADLETDADSTTNVGATDDLHIKAKGYEATLGYGFDYESGTVTVDKRAITVTASGTSIYGNATGAITTEVTGGSLVNGATLSGAATTAASNTSNVGNYNITQGTITVDDGNAGNNYAITFIGTDGYEITKRVVSITVTGSGTYGEDPVIGYNATVGNIVNNDELTLALDGSKNSSGWYDAGNYDVVLGSSTTNDNYNVTFANDDYTINRRTITVTGVTDSRQYGDANPSVGYSVGGSGLATGDSLSGSVNFNADSTSNVGGYDITQGGVTNANNANYDITWADGRLTVTKRQITVTADEASRMMGQPNPEFTWSLSSGSMANDETLTVSLRSDADADSPVGLYDIIMTAFSIAGVDSGNYQVNFVGQNRLTVTALPSESGNDINVYLPFPGAAPDGGATADGTSLRPPPLASLVGDSAGPDAAGRDAFASFVNVGAVSNLSPASVRMTSSFIITHKDWKALNPVESADTIANYGAASIWRTVPLAPENASRTATGISLDEARSLFLPHHAVPEGWEHRVELVDTGEKDEDGNPIMGVRVTMVRKA